MTLWVCETLYYAAVSAGRDELIVRGLRHVLKQWIVLNHSLGMGLHSGCQEQP
eukprot:CAMPEP_0172209956 /NCGR_PEP_ID=MMETSP1050-20130122/35443_1 /TAXON_ID=233186 /ORGANISM="Cryptomonas curvata, Strain CCAP979/52" /LENGTH=52 /DNA_ID=CAMNT_0012889971 /DNA_START=13 /DNA_END=167 /DNA_ORIENTATION=+